MNEVTATVNLPASFIKALASGGKDTASLIYPQKKNTKGVKSGEQGGQVIGQPTVV
jgi:hypothetical protein